VYIDHGVCILIMVCVYSNTIQAEVVALCLLVSPCCSTVRPAGDLCSKPFKQHLPEDGHKRWPKYLERYAVHIKINLHIFTHVCWFFFSKRNSILFVCVALSIFSTSRTFPNFTADPNTSTQVSQIPSSPR